MIKTKTILGAILVAVAVSAAPMVTMPVQAAETTQQIAKQPWTFAGIFGTFDKNQLQRGFQVFKEVCASCHSMNLMAFRNLSQKGGPEFSEEQVKALAATYEIADPDAEGGVRPGVAADRWPAPFATEQDARDANGGAYPPDLSVIAKARSASQPFPWWILNYFTPYAEGGTDYLHALLTGYEETVPEGTLDSQGNPFVLPEGKYYNHYFPGHAIGMPPPLADGLVTYEAAEDGSVIEPTVEQTSRDVTAFLMWIAEPHLVDRKETGFKVMAFLFLFAVIMYLVKRQLWRNVEH